MTCHENVCKYFNQDWGSGSGGSLSLENKKKTPETWHFYDSVNGEILLKLKLDNNNNEYYNKACLNPKYC